MEKGILSETRSYKYSKNTHIERLFDWVDGQMDGEKDRDINRWTDGQID